MINHDCEGITPNDTDCKAQAQISITHEGKLTHLCYSCASSKCLELELLHRVEAAIEANLEKLGLPSSEKEKIKKQLIN